MTSGNDVEAVARAMFRVGKENWPANELEESEHYNWREKEAEAQAAIAALNIPAMEARIKELEEAAKPFAEALDPNNFEHSPRCAADSMTVNFGIMNGNISQTIVYGKLKVGDFRRARSALGDQHET